ncbi:MAG: hypothetical protein FWG35_07080 [Spirochaetaceae bacterium]|nr:hypothetical protein [Spirochaetaceae bacterium]
MEIVIAVREKLHTLIDEIPDECLASVEPLLTYLAREQVIETNLTDEEKLWIQEGRNHYREHPEEFVPLESLKK